MAAVLCKFLHDVDDESTILPGNEFERCMWMPFLRRLLLAFLQGYARDAPHLDA
jgi:hypothetical protein